MLQKLDTSNLFSYYNPDGVLLTINSDYNLFSAELKSINVDYENRTIDDIIQELTEIRTLYYFEFCDESNSLDPEIVDDEDFIKINFMIDYIENLKLYCEEKIE